MVGRGSMGNPEIFKQINEYLKNGVEAIPENTTNQMKEHIRLYEHCINEYLNENCEIPYSEGKFKLMELRRNLIWLSKNVQDSTNLRIKISKTKTLEELEQIIDSLN